MELYSWLGNEQRSLYVNMLKLCYATIMQFHSYAVPWYRQTHSWTIALFT